MPKFLTLQNIILKINFLESSFVFYLLFQLSMFYMPTTSTTNHYVKYYHNYSTYIIVKAIKTEVQYFCSIYIYIYIFLDNNYNISINESEISVMKPQLYGLWRVKVDQFVQQYTLCFDFVRVKVVIYQKFDYQCQNYYL